MRGRKKPGAPKVAVIAALVSSKSSSTTSWPLNGAVVIALRKPDGRFDITPSPDVPIEVGDVVIAIGTEPELRALEDVFSTKTLAV